jgi:hypothetical protein
LRLALNSASDLFAVGKRNYRAATKSPVLRLICDVSSVKLLIKLSEITYRQRIRNLMIVLTEFDADWSLPLFNGGKRNRFD